MKRFFFAGLFLLLSALSCFGETNGPEYTKEFIESVDRIIDYCYRNNKFGKPVLLDSNIIDIKGNKVLDKYSKSDYEELLSNYFTKILKYQYDGLSEIKKICSKEEYQDIKNKLNDSKKNGNILIPITINDHVTIGMNILNSYSEEYARTGFNRFTEAYKNTFEIYLEGIAAARGFPKYHWAALQFIHAIKQRPDYPEAYDLLGQTLNNLRHFGARYGSGVDAEYFDSLTAACEQQFNLSEKFKKILWTKVKIVDDGIWVWRDQKDPLNEPHKNIVK